MATGLLFYTNIFDASDVIQPIGLEFKLLKKLFPEIVNSALFLTSYCTSGFSSMPQRFPGL